jgi:3-isopropylmalate/(R)-2-methylmalate dehydratase large subunit
MTAKNIVEKIWQQHIVTQQTGHPAVFAIDFMLMHEVTSAQAFTMLEKKQLSVFNPKKVIATLDHSIPTRKNRSDIYDEAARLQVETLRANCKKYGITLYDYGSHHQGIVHVIGPELGITQPGMTIVCGDSHTSTHGAFGALAFGVGTTEVGYVLATGCILQQKPKTMRVEFKGKFKKGVYAKDAILKLIATIGIGGATGHIIEYTGDAITNMTMEERMTICNMSIECGARAGLVAPDATTFAYIADRPYAPKGDEFDRAVRYWQSLVSDSDCHYDREIVIDVANLQPMVTWGTNPGQAIQINETIPRYQDLTSRERADAEKALQYNQLHDGATIAGTAIEWAFIGSCTNGRIEDLRVAASILKNHTVHPAVTFYIVPGSEAVREQAINEGLDKIFLAAGADFRMPGCSMCLAMNDDKVPAGQRCISTSNRNFVGRQGQGSFTHLASPATVAASAINGKITSAEAYL